MSTESLPPPALSRPSPRRWPWVVGLLGLLVAAVAVWLRYQRPPEPSPVTPEEQPAPVAAAPPAQPEAPIPADPLPTLGASDGLARDWAGRISSSAAWFNFFSGSDLIRRMVALVASVADGERPVPLLAGLTVRGPFEVTEEGGRSYIAPSTYARYDELGAAVASIDSAQAANALRTLEPLLQQAWKEIAPPRWSFRQGLARAIGHLLATPEVATPVEVAPSGGIFVFADPELEKLSPAQKQLLRMGPENGKKVRAKLTELSQAMELAPSPK